MSLLNKWFSRLLTTGRSRTNSPVSPLERLEPRLALAGDVARPLLERAAVLYLDSTMFGPEPVVMTKSQVVGHDENSFVISHVPTGSVVEKLDAEMNTWIDVSTKPTSSNPRELLRLLQRRLIKHGEKIRWVTESNQGGELTEAFRLISWDDGSKPVQREESSPSDVSDLVARAGDVGGELVIEWSDLNDDVSSYSVLVSSEEGSQIHKTTSASLTLQNMPAGIEYEVEVWATNENGSSSTKGTLAQINTYNILLTPHSLNNSQSKFSGNQYWLHYSNKNLPHSTLTSKGLKHQNQNYYTKKEAEDLIAKWNKNKLRQYKFGPKHSNNSFRFDAKPTQGQNPLWLAHYDSNTIDEVLKFLRSELPPKQEITSNAGKHFTIGYTHQYNMQDAETFVNKDVMLNQNMYLTVVNRETREWFSHPLHY